MVLGASTASSSFFQSPDEEFAQSVELIRSTLFLEDVFRTLPLSVSYFNEGTFKNEEEYPVSPYKVIFDSVAEKRLAGIPIHLRCFSSDSGQITYSLGQEFCCKNFHFRKMAKYRRR